MFQWDKSETGRDEVNEARMIKTALPRFLAVRIRVSIIASFDIVSDFGFRISDFKPS